MTDRLRLEDYLPEVILEFDELADWATRNDDDDDHLDILVQRMRRADDGALMPHAQSTTCLLALLNELHPPMRSLLLRVDS